MDRVGHAGSVPKKLGPSLKVVVAFLVYMG